MTGKDLDYFTVSGTHRYKTAEDSNPYRRTDTALAVYRKNQSEDGNPVFLGLAQVGFRSSCKPGKSLVLKQVALRRFDANEYQGYRTVQRPIVWHNLESSDRPGYPHPQTWVYNQGTRDISSCGDEKIISLKDPGDEDTNSLKDQYHILRQKLDALTEANTALEGRVISLETSRDHGSPSSGDCRPGEALVLASPTTQSTPHALNTKIGQPARVEDTEEEPW